MRGIFYTIFALFVLNINYIAGYFSHVYGILTPLIFLLLIIGFNKLRVRDISILKSKYVNGFIIFIILLCVCGLINIILRSDFKGLDLSFKNSALTVLGDRLKSVLILLFTFGFFLSLKNRNEWLNSMKVVEKIMLLGTSSIIIFYFLKIDIFNTYYNQYGNFVDRASGLFGNPNFAGYLGDFTLAIVFYSKATNKSNLKFYWLKIIVCALAVILTFSNTAILILAVLLFINLAKKINIKYLIPASVCLILFYLLLTNYSIFNFDFSKNQLSRVDNQIALFTLDTKDVNTSSRIKIWDKGLELIADYPLTGYGIGAFENNVLETQGIHNTFLQLFGEGGIIFFIYYLLIIFFLLKKIYSMKKSPSKTLAISIIVTYLIFSFTTHELFANVETMFFLAITFFIFKNFNHTIEKNYSFNS